jgi:MFS transporter, DHA1 family, tetracycline resistance protein
MSDVSSDSPVSVPPKKPMFIAALVVAIDLLGFGIVLPLMPRLAEDYLKGQSEFARGATIGILFSSFSLMQFIFSPMWGRVSDRIGRRPILLLGLLGSVLFYALFAYASSLPPEQATLAIGLMLLSRIGAGIAGASVGTAAAVIADCTTKDKRAKGMALIGAAFGVGFTVGPLIAYFGLELFEGKKWGVGVIASLLSLAAFLLAVVILPETRNPNHEAERRGFFSISQTLEVLRMPDLGPLVLIYFLAIFGFANFEATLAMFTKAVFGYDDRQNFLVFAAVGAVLMVAQGGLYRPLVGRWKEGRMMAVGILLMLMGLSVIGIVAAGALFLNDMNLARGMTPLFFLAMSVAVIGFAFVNPSVSALISQRADPNRQGEILGVNQAAASLGRILGPFIGSVAFEMHASRTMPYLIAGMALCFVALILPNALKKQSAPQTTDSGTPASS